MHKTSNMCKNCKQEQQKKYESKYKSLNGMQTHDSTAYPYMIIKLYNEQTFASKFIFVNLIYSIL